MIEIRHQNMERTQDTQAAYDAFFREHRFPLRDSFYLWLISLLNPQPGQRLIDISCGQGRLVRLAQEQGLLAYGADFAQSGLQIGRHESPASGWVMSDGERLGLAPACMDYVTHIGSLEHYQNPTAGAREIARILKPTGQACVLLPNSFGLFGNIQQVWRTGEVFDDGQPLQRYNTLAGWQKMLETGGLRVERIVRYEREWPRTSADWQWSLMRPAKLLRACLAPLVPLPFANCLVYLCRRA